MKMNHSDYLRVGLAQISPVWLNKLQTTDKILSFITDAAAKGCDLVCFGESLLPGYPFWISLTDGARFNSNMQKSLYSYYLKNSVDIESGDLASICRLAREKNIAVYLGIAERAKDRGGHSIYCSLVYITNVGIIGSVHRKLQPTYEERLVWANGDGHGLQVHSIKNFTAGGLNCWENWMPLSRMALYSMGENLHIAVWPGSESLTKDITRFIALESRSYVISASGLMLKKDIQSDMPFYDEILSKAPEELANGGSCVAGPGGEWIKEPVRSREGLIIENLDINRVYEERQNFDVVGHYSRPDVTKLIINRGRQSILSEEDGSGLNT